MIVGSGNYRYELAEGWGRLPYGYEWNQAADVSTDSQDRVYVFNRSAHPVMVFDNDGRFLYSWGEGQFIQAHTFYIKDDIH